LVEAFAHTTVSPAHACFASASVWYLGSVLVVGWPVEVPAPVLVGAWSVPGGGDVVGVCALATPAVVNKHIKAIALACRTVLLL